MEVQNATPELGMDGKPIYDNTQGPFPIHESAGVQKLRKDRNELYAALNDLVELVNWRATNEWLHPSYEKAKKLLEALK